MLSGSCVENELEQQETLSAWTRHYPRSTVHTEDEQVAGDGSRQRRERELPPHRERDGQRCEVRRRKLPSPARGSERCQLQLETESQPRNAHVGPSSKPQKRKRKQLSGGVQICRTRAADRAALSVHTQVRGLWTFSYTTGFAAGAIVFYSFPNP